MKRLPCILLSIIFAISCDSGYLESEDIRQLVVEGWIENGHAPVVFVSTTMPVGSDPRPLSDISEHILRYAEVYIETGGKREYLTARLTGLYSVSGYFTSPTLRGQTGQSYTLHVKWQEFEACANCTIPETVNIETSCFEQELNDTSFVAVIGFRNDPSKKLYYQSFLRTGDPTVNYRPVNFTSLDGSLLDEEVTERFMSPLLNKKDVYFHPGDTVAIKLATTEYPIYEYWKSYSNYSNSQSNVLTAPRNIKGNVEGAIGYWAGYGIDIREMILAKETKE